MCGSSARTDLCGGRQVTGVPTATNRELKRNFGASGYQYREAQGRADTRRHNASCRPHKMTSETVSAIEEKLEMQWSPDQIAGWLACNDSAKKVSHETIYRHVWSNKRRGGELYKQLRHNGKKYNKRSSNGAGRGCIPGRIDIDERPAIVEKKARIGDWEIDTIIGCGHKGAIVSMVDRASKFTKLALVKSKRAQEVGQALIERLVSLKDFVLTLTSDNGKEFANHKSVSQALDTHFYFAKPYHSWERGLNEHTNGLVRQYFPKGTHFESVTDDEVQIVEDLLNNRPRKVLQYRTPREVFDHLIRCSPIPSRSVALQS